MIGGFKFFHDNGFANAKGQPFTHFGAMCVAFDVNEWLVGRTEKRLGQTAY
jgi:hypothetical protein